MKMRSFIIAAMSYVVILFAASCSVEGYVTDRPADVTYDRPAAPGEGYVWISGDWVWDGGTYHWNEGHWERTHEGHTWVAGHWESHRHGWKWHRGHWE